MESTPSSPTTRVGTNCHAAPSFGSSFAGSYALVDLETTGGSAGYNRIMEVGIVLLEDGKVREEWSALVNPEQHISSHIETFTGITNEMVAAAPRFAAVAQDIFARLEGRIFVAHNARFDYGFLRAEFRRLGIRFKAPVLCTVKLSRRLYPQEPRHNLDAVMQRHGLVCESRHRALGDARVLADFFSALDIDIEAAMLRSELAALTEEPKLPPGLDADSLDDLPDVPGIYRMFGEGELLYVGSAKNIRSRVLGHFMSASTKQDRQLVSDVRRIDWTETAGELGALLAQMKFSRELQPLLRSASNSDRPFFSIELHDHDGWLRPAIAELNASSDLQRFGLFRSERDAHKALREIAASRGLCLKVLGLEESDGSCVGLQLGRCRGACVGKEVPGLHNARLQLALASLKLKEWPFAAAIAVRERSWTGIVELHVFHQWRYLGSTADPAEVAELAAARDLPPFDHEIYKLLVRQLRRNDLDVVPISSKANTFD